jgi:teichuronic acid biosynthesis glycosyltransferase TuaG
MISIFIPLYNGIEFIHESVGSVLQQTFESWELLIGVNGHPPNSSVFKKAKEWEKENNKIRVFDFPDIQGKSNTLNELVKHSKYDYVALLDVDDVWYPTKLETQVPFLGKYDVIGSHCLYFGDLHYSPKLPSKDISIFHFRRTNPIINSSVLIRKELAYWRDQMLEDYDLWIRLRKQGKLFYNCPEILVKHRLHEKSAFNSKNGQYVKELLKSHFG